MEAIIGLILGGIIGFMLSHVYNERSFVIHVKHESMVTGLPENVDLDDLLNMNKTSAEDRVYEDMGSNLVNSITEIMNGGSK